MSKLVRLGVWSFGLLIMLLSTAGCGSSSFLGRKYDNFTAYYNTFYNAKNAFEEGARALERSTEPVDRRYYVSIFTVSGSASNAQSFQNAVDKSADVLRDHPDSKWVDDALLLIGKAYFYQENYVGAEQKFQEVTEIGTALEDEARFWLARTLIASGAYDEARDHLIVSLNREDLSKRWAPQLHLALGQLYVKQESFLEAAEELMIGLENVRDNDLEARGWFLLGQVLETLENYEDAAAAYTNVRRSHPRYELSYAADLSAIRVRGLYLDAESALRDLRRMERDDKHYSSRFELAYLRGLIYQAQDRPNEAREIYREILYDSDGQIGDLRGRIHYALGELYRDAHKDYLLAAAHFDTARTSMSSGPASVGQQQLQYAPEAITNVERTAEIFTTFAQARTDVAHMDSLLELGSLDEEAFAERILEIRRQKARELAVQQRQAERRQAERGFQEAAQRASADENGEFSQNQETGTAGFLFHRDPIRVQESRLSFIDRWGERPHVPNWRRMEAVTAAVASSRSAGEAIEENLRDVSPGVGEAPLPPLDYSNVPRDSLTKARMRAERALARYELGNVLFLSMSRPDSAAAWYRMVIDEDSDEEVAQRAYYALAEVQRSLGDSSAAESIYKQVLRDFPESDFAGRVREQLGIRQDVPTDSLAVAYEEYDEAFSRWQRGLHSDALNRMISLAASYAGTEVAPKALLAAGQIYLEWANEDSLSFFDPLPLTLADSLLNRAGLRDVIARTDSSAAIAENQPADSLGLPGERSPLAGANTPGTPPDADSAWTPAGNDSTGALTATAHSTIEDSLSAIDDSPSAIEDSLSAIDDAYYADDTLYADEDSVYAEADSLAVNPAVTTRADSSLLRPVLPDSLEAGLASADSIAFLDSPRPVLASAQDDAIYLMTLYASVRQLYPSTAYADQAGAMLDVLDAEIAAKATPDSGAVMGDPATLQSLAAMDSLYATETDSVAWDSLAAWDTMPAGDSQAPAESPYGRDSLAVTERSPVFDSLAVAGRSQRTDSLASRAITAPEDTLDAQNEASAGATFESGDSPSIPQGENAIRGEGGIQEELGGFTLVIGTNVNRETMETLAAKYAARGFRTDVIAEKIGSTQIYRAAVGHFDTQRAAGEAMNEYKASFDEVPHVTSLASVEPAPVDDALSSPAGDIQ